jgi:hypothetical protein
VWSRFGRGECHSICGVGSVNGDEADKYMRHLCVCVCVRVHKRVCMPTRGFSSLTVLCVARPP